MSATDTVSSLQSTLLARFSYLTPRSGSADHPAVNVPAENLVSFATALRDELGFDMLTDIAGADWDQESPRFAAVYHFVRTAKCEYLRVVCAAPDDVAPSIPSLVALYPSANWFEREAHDMFGIDFAGHPDLRRILMWDSYPWHPLRKEFPLAGKETDIPSDDQIEGARTKVRPAPLAGGPFVATPGKTMHDGEPHGKDQSWNETQPKPTR